MYRPLAVLAGIASVTGGCVIIADDDATLTVHNHPGYVLTEVHLAQEVTLAVCAFN